jgi:2-keto-4-pentenoate hydratase
MDAERNSQLAEVLAQAWERAQAVPAPTSVAPDITLDDAYAIQDGVIDLRLATGRRRAGWKMGLTSSPDATPIVGTLLDDMIVASGVTLNPDSMVAPLVEAELAFVVGEPIGTAPDVDDIARGSHRVAAALEVIDYRTRDSKGVVDWVADNSTVAYAVLGPELELGDVGSLGSIEVTLRSDGEEIATGEGRRVMGDPLRAIAWLARHLATRHRTLDPGAVVLTGSLTGHHNVTPGSAYTASFSGLGEVSVRFATGN